MYPPTHRVIINHTSCYLTDDGATLSWADQEQCDECGRDAFSAVRLPKTRALMAVTCDHCGARFEALRLMREG